MPKKSSRLIVALLIAGLASGAHAQSAKKPKEGKESSVLVTVNGSAVPKSRAEVLINEQVAQGAPENDALKNAVREELIRREVLSVEARRAGLENTSTVQAQMELARQAVLIRAYLQDYIKKNPVSDEAAKREYDIIKASLGDKEYKARHILVEKESEATDIIARLQKGEKFEELANRLSKDPGSKDRGGDLGWNAPGSFVTSFAEALRSLQRGAFTTKPVATEYGYHVIKLDEVRELKVPSFEDSKQQIQQKLQQQAVEEHVAALRKRAKIAD
jgi:peptidyl-prolyl cis-trans isomerase C